MRKTLARWVEFVWYKESIVAVLLLPLAFLFAGLVKFRKLFYRLGLLKSCTLPVPVIVIGNISVGGTGKTPFIIWLAQFLKESGFKPGIISRGYGGKAGSWPQWVDNTSSAEQVGDEALVIARQSVCPMAVGPSRIDAAKLLLERADCNVILSDDGLQHYALRRDIEVAVVDGARRFGNGYCLPAGPLREPVSRLQSVDFVIVNGGQAGNGGEKKEFSMQLDGDTAVNLLTGERKALIAFKGINCHALAGIGNPERFFRLLTAAGLNCTTHGFPDHYRFQPHDLDFPNLSALLMTEKDAVKCASFARNQHWYVPVKAVLELSFPEQLLSLLKEKNEEAKQKNEF